MLNVIDIFPKDITAVIEISVKELDQLDLFFSLSTLNYDNDEKEHMKAIEFVTKKFIPFIQKLLEDTK